MTVSLGIASSCAGESEELLVHRVDHALYRAKASGRNCAVPYQGELAAADDAGPGPDHGEKRPPAK